MFSINKYDIIQKLQENNSVKEQEEYKIKLFNKLKKEADVLNESYFRDKLADSLDNARTEVEVIGGYVDIITDTEIIEVKRIGLWKASIGQVLVYSLYFDDKDKRIHLIDDYRDINKNIIDSVCNDLGIKVTYEKDPVLKQIKENIDRIGNNWEDSRYII